MLSYLGIDRIGQSQQQGQQSRGSSRIECKCSRRRWGIHSPNVSRRPWSYLLVTTPAIVDLEPPEHARGDNVLVEEVQDPRGYS